MSLETEPRRRRGGARANPGAGGGAVIPQLPRRQLQRKFAPTNILSADEIESIHQSSLQVLNEVGMDFILPEARDLLQKSGGVKIDGERVRFDKAFIEEYLACAPSEFTVHARNPENNMVVGGNNMVFGTVGSPPSCFDMEGGRRTGNQADYQKFLKLGQHFNAINFSAGYPVEPVDIHPKIRHLDALRDMATLMDKPMTAYMLGAPRVHDALEIARIARGVSREQFEREATLLTIINTNSPLKLDAYMLNGIMEMSSRGQVVCVTFYARWCHGPGDHGGCLGGTKRRSPGRPGLLPIGQKGCAGHLWRLHFQCGHEIGRACFWHAGIYESRDGRRPTGQALQNSLPHLQHLCGQHGGCPSRL